MALTHTQQTAATYTPLLINATEKAQGIEAQLYDG